MVLFRDALVLLIGACLVGVAEVAATPTGATSRFRAAATWAWLLRALAVVPPFALPLVLPPVMPGGGEFAVLRGLSVVVFAVLPFGLVLHAARRARLWAGVLAVAVVLVGIDAFLVEPRALEVTVETVKVEGMSRPVRVALVADLQTDHPARDLPPALAALREADPDLVLLAGDYVQVYDPVALAAAEVEFRHLWAEGAPRAPLGVFAVQGDTEGRGWTTLFEGLRVHAAGTTSTVDLADLRVTLLDLRASASTRPTVENVRRPHVVLGHRPDFALGDVNADVLLAGHTHGGQVRLPFVGPLVTFSNVPRAWAAGRTELSGGRTLVVSRGIGMERGDAPRMRFLCRPELVIIDLVPG